jgi:hypothetical protein
MQKPMNLSPGRYEPWGTYFPVIDPAKWTFNLIQSISSYENTNTLMTFNSGKGKLLAISCKQARCHPLSASSFIV